MLLLLILGPAVRFTYLLFPERGFGEYLVNIGPIQVVNNIEGIDNWYYVYFYHYFYSIGELLGPVVTFLGVFLLFPKKYYPSYLVGVPFGYYSSMLIHRMFFTQNNDDFYGSFQNAVSVAFIIFGIVLFFVTDKYLSRNELKKQAVVARIAGLIKVDGLSWGDKEAMLNEEATKMIEVDNELFNRKPI